MELTGIHSANTIALDFWLPELLVKAFQFVAFVLAALKNYYKSPSTLLHEPGRKYFRLI